MASWKVEEEAEKWWSYVESSNSWIILENFVTVNNSPNRIVKQGSTRIDDSTDMTTLIISKEDTIEPYRFRKFFENFENYLTKLTGYEGFVETKVLGESDGHKVVQHKVLTSGEYD